MFGGVKYKNYYYPWCLPSVVCFLPHSVSVDFPSAYIYILGEQNR